MTKQHKIFLKIARRTQLAERKGTRRVWITVTLYTADWNCWNFTYL